MVRRQPMLFALTIVLLALASLSAPSPAQTLKSGPQVLTFFSDVDDTEQSYAIYLPKEFNPRKKYPLVISLHGAGSNHRLNLRRVFGKSNQGEENAVPTHENPRGGSKNRTRPTLCGHGNANAKMFVPDEIAMY